MFGIKTTDGVLKTLDKATRDLGVVADVHRAQRDYHAERKQHHEIEVDRHANETARALRVQSKIAALIA